MKRWIYPVGSSQACKIIKFTISKTSEYKTVINNLEYTLARHDRIGIIGKNGQGTVAQNFRTEN